jgi:PAS domain S-box-containing protein
MRLDDPVIFRSIAENMQIGLYLIDRERRIVFWNKEAERITGYMQHEVLGRCCRHGLLMHCDDAGKLLCVGDCPLAQSMRDGLPREGDVYLHHKAGHRILVRVRALPVRLSDGSIVGAAETFEERPIFLLSERRRASLAAHGCLDPGTALPNWCISQSRVRESLNLFTEHHFPFGLLAIQVDHPQEFQHAHSREALSALLQVLAKSISHLIGPDGFLGHWTTYRFLAVIPDCSSVDLDRIAKHICDLVKRSDIEWWGDHLAANVQVGYSMAEPGDCAEMLIERARQSIERRANHQENGGLSNQQGSSQPAGS